MSADRPAPDVAIVGCGIVGAALAAFLAEAGLRVRVYERTAIGAGASGRNSGLVQHPFDSVLGELYGATLAEYRALAAAGRLPFPAEPAGLLYVGRNAPLAARIAADWAAAWPATGPEVVDGPALASLEPGLARDLTVCRLGVGFPVGPGAATMALAEWARTLGAEVVLGADVRAVRTADRVAGVTGPDGRLQPAGCVVLAGGPWTSSLVDPSGRWRPIRPVWGVVASVRLAGAPRHGLEAIDIDIEPGSGERAVGEIAPRDELVDFSLVPGAGSSALGSTFLPAEPEPQAWLTHLRNVGSRYVPALAAAEVVGLRHCARPVSLDGRPLVGRVSGVDGLWIAAGHGPWGISTGPGTARLLAGAILADDPSALPAALRPDRFGAAPA
ncbi:MAG TPA: FAD-dependent oxidoreductase [Candidatus Limnocylindrales bacterium]|nr:FAD-dependent oxidoreductase [Candidatus Limnocylindrales bacterium]